MRIGKELAVIGVGYTNFGDNFEMSYYDMVINATYDALEDAGITNDDIQAAWLSTVFPFAYGFEGSAGTSLSDPVNLFGKPVTRVGACGAGGMEAFRNAALAVSSGEYDIVLAVGCEKMRDVKPRESLVVNSLESGHPLLYKGRTAPGMFGLIAHRYMKTYNYPRDIFAMVAVKNHHNGVLNPKAALQSEVTLEQVLNAPMIASPLGLMDCAPAADGAAAAVITTVENAKKMDRSFSRIDAISVAVTEGYFSAQSNQKNDFLGFSSTRIAAKDVYKKAGINNPAKELDLVECHDCFTVTEIINYEDLYLCDPGLGGKMIDDGSTFITGDIPVNPSGGLKSFGHPIGATGVRMIAEVHNHLHERAGKRQVELNNYRGIAHTLGGPGSIAAIVMLSKDV